MLLSPPGAREKLLQHTCRESELLVHQGVLLSRDAVFRLLEICLQTKGLHGARQVHALMVCSGLDSSTCVGYHLIRLFTACSSVFNASCIFAKVSVSNVYTWNAIIAAHVELGSSMIAVELFSGMQQKGVDPDRFSFLSILRACSAVGAVVYGRSIHDMVLKCGLELDVEVMNTVIDMYTKCASLAEARKVFDRLLCRDVVSWNVLIAGYATVGDGSCALELVNEMQQEGRKPHIFSFASILKACAGLGTLEPGRWMHDQIIRSGYESNVPIGSALVDMYAKCGILAEARLLFDQLENRDLLAWTAMISGYVAAGKHNIALKVYVRMLQEGMLPDNYLFASILKACGSIQEAEWGREIHNQIVKIGLDQDVIIRIAIVDMYVNCGSLESSFQVSESFQTKNVLLWNALIKGYVKQGFLLSALGLFKRMHESDIEIDKALFVSLIKACGHLADLQVAKLINELALGCGWDADLMVWNSVLVMFVNCGDLLQARDVFNKMLNRDIESWTTIIKAYIQHGQCLLASQLFMKMQHIGIVPDTLLFLSLLKVCSDIEGVWLTHDLITKFGLDLDLVVGSALINMHIKCGTLEDAHSVFVNLQCPDVVVWGIMIAGYADRGNGLCALRLFEKMQEVGAKADNEIYICILKSCNHAHLVCQGRLIHDQIIRNERESQVVIGNTLVHMYTKCNCLEEAQRVFDNLIERDLVSWGALMTGYVQSGNAHIVLEFYKMMREEHLQPDITIYSCVLRACGHPSALEQGRLIHNQMILRGIELDVVVGSALLGMYAKCGKLQEAYQVFVMLESKDELCWNTLISGCAMYGHGQLVLELYKKLRQAAVLPSKGTVLWVLKACADVGTIEQGSLLHNDMTRIGMELDTILGNTLVDMYCKCGSLEDALKVFHNLPSRDVVSWSVMIAGFVLHGKFALAQKYFENMQHQSLQSNDAIIMAIIGACSHTGLLKEGVVNFSLMKVVHGLSPKLEHYSCMVDLLSRAGFLNAAVDLIQTMPIAHDSIMWTSLLSSCNTYNYIELGKSCLIAHSSISQQNLETQKIIKV